MPRYYFDIRDENDLAVDEEGMWLRDMQAVQEEAARSLAGVAWDEVRRTSDRNRHHRMAIEVRDDYCPVLEVKFTFAIARRIRPSGGVSPYHFRNESKLLELPRRHTRRLAHWAQRSASQAGAVPY
ncbi:DUF6894 family protein [Bradyrhizobium jicamae]|uniref:DUF6894 family protein n=1 Tax=Bradyrhizobium jicamae TaxID=280332 RepID=UPI000A657665